MVRVGLFGTFDGDDAVIATVLRAELARRMPGLELRTYTPGGDPVPSGIAEPVTWSDQPLGSFGSIRQEELAATLDAVVIAGSVALDPGPHAPARLLVEGLGAFEPEVPVAWFAVTPTGSPSPIGADLAREGLARRVGIWVVGGDARQNLAALGVTATRAVPHPALALPRLAAAADLPQVVERLRAAALLPPDDYLALGEGAEDVAQGARLGSAAPWTVMDRIAAIAGSAAYIGDSPTACAIAAAYGRPAVWTGPPEEAPSFAVAIGAAVDLAAAATRARTHPPDPARIAAQVAELDAALDALVAVLAGTDDARAERALRIRLREQERAAAEREQDLLAYNEHLSTEIVAKGPRFTALWRKIHEADRHYHWHKLRADRADEEIEKLWRLHEDRLSIRMKRKVRSTKVGDAAARALGAGPLAPAPGSELGPEGPDAPSA
jgi:hypothetical protein